MPTWFQPSVYNPSNYFIIHFIIDFIMKTTNTYIMEIAIDLDDILNAVYSQSAWHCAHNKQLYRLTSDNSTMLSLKIKEAFDNIYTQNMAYVSFANFNPNLDHANVRFTFRFGHPFHEALP